MKERRFGKFYVSENFTEDADLFAILQEMKFIPYRVEYLAYELRFEYIGYSPLFEPLKELEATPFYNIKITDNRLEGTLKVEVERNE